VGIQYAGVSVMLGIGFLVAWLAFAGYRVRNFPARAILSLSGHLRPRPDPWLEVSLRAAFAEFDRELTLILQDAGATRPGPPPPARTDNHLRDLPRLSGRIHRTTSRRVTFRERQPPGHSRSVPSDASHTARTTGGTRVAGLPPAT
jgi:hypothetical protein